jgi:hypothetical protein
MVRIKSYQRDVMNKITQCKKCLAHHNRGKAHVCDSFMLKLVEKKKLERIRNGK